MADLGFAKKLRPIYMYLVALVSVVVFVIGSVTLLNTALKTWVFPVTSYYGNSIYNCSPESIKGMGGFETTEECIAYFDEQDRVNFKNELYRDLSFGISMTTISLIIWFLHMWFIAKDRKENES